jgi:3-deoxy-D-manno-octulosonic-acid transferase
VTGVVMHAYRTLARAATPLAPLVLARRAARGKEDRERIRERLGHASLPRPAGRLVWVHAASVGESVSALPLLERVRAARPDVALLMTTGTVASASLMARRLPAGALHQYAPLDLPSAVARFLDHWRPDAALWVEQELWPTLLGATRARGIPAGLVNGRLSPRSFARWSRAASFAGEVLSSFAVVLARSEADAARLRSLGARDVRCLGDLKAAAPPLPVDPDALAEVRAELPGPAWVAASTHPGEEAIVAAAHRALRDRVPGLATIVAPRHPARGPAIAEALASGAVPVTRRGAGERPVPGIHVADTLGELGLFYRVARAAFVGGSLVPHGGHNPLEAARLGCPVLVGPHTANVAEATEALLAAGAAVRVTAATLADELARLLSDEVARERMAGAAHDATAGGEAVLDAVAAAIVPILP